MSSWASSCGDFCFLFRAWDGLAESLAMRLSVFSASQCEILILSRRAKDLPAHHHDLGLDLGEFFCAETIISSREGFEVAESCSEGAHRYTQRRREQWLNVLSGCPKWPRTKEEQNKKLGGYIALLKVSATKPLAPARNIAFRIFVGCIKLEPQLLPVAAGTWDRPLQHLTAACSATASTAVVTLPP